MTLVSAAGLPAHLPVVFPPVLGGGGRYRREYSTDTFSKVSGVRLLTFTLVTIPWLLCWRLACRLPRTVRAASAGAEAERAAATSLVRGPSPLHPRALFHGVKGNKRG